MSKYLSLDSFDSLLKQADSNIESPIDGRIKIHICSEIKEDILPNYCYKNSIKRFVEPESSNSNKSVPVRPEPPIYKGTKLWGSNSIELIYQEIQKLYKGFIGQEHLKCVIKYLKYNGLAYLINEFFLIIKNTVQSSLKE